MSENITLTGGALEGIGPRLLSAYGEAPTVEVVHLGRVRPKARPQALALSAYFDPNDMATPPPAALDYSTKAAAAIARMYLNDRLGCCVISAKAHAAGIWSGNDADSGGLLQASDAEILAAYRIWNPGTADNGCSMAQVNNYFRATGLAFAGARRRIDGYVSVDWRNQVLAQVGIMLFGGIDLGINLPQAWTSAAVWDVTPTPIVGGHNVMAIGWNAQGFLISSWGRIYLMTYAAFTSTRWNEEAYCLLAPLWYGNDKLAPCGIDATTLAADLAKIGGGTIPPIDPVPPPVPVPVPPVPVPPVPAPADTVGLRIPHDLVAGKIYELKLVYQ